MLDPLRLYLGSDHGGFLCKQGVITALHDEGLELRDVGTFDLVSVDYPAFALKVAQCIKADQGSFGILFCRSGEGMEMAANKVPGIRAALAWNEEVSAETRLDNDSNILVVPADFVSLAQAVAIVRRFLATPFSMELRHQRRIDELTDIERLSYAS